jgi:hypothetical protein
MARSMLVSAHSRIADYRYVNFDFGAAQKEKRLLAYPAFAADGAIRNGVAHK